MSCIINQIDFRFYTHICSNPHARLFYHLAPLLFGNKPAITYRSQSDDFRNFFDACRSMTAMDKRVLVHLIKSDDSREQLDLYYQPDRLAQVLRLPENRHLLSQFGYYPEYDLEGDLHTLISRMDGTFPHEIGIFLGIPVADVIGFLRNKGKNYLLAGYWKVYHDPQYALNIFAGFDRAKQIAADYIINNKIIKTYV